MLAPHPPRRHGARSAADPASPALHGATDVPPSITPAAQGPPVRLPTSPRGRRHTAATLVAGLTRAPVGASVEGGA